MSVEDVRAKFPIKTICNIDGEKTYKSINEIRKALYGNASANPTSLEGGRGGAVATSVYSCMQKYVPTWPPHGTQG